jgi:hypothetical protein
MLPSRRLSRWEVPAWVIFTACSLIPIALAAIVLRPVRGLASLTSAFRARF